MNNKINFSVIDTPKDETVIWRYMSFDRFKQLIESSELYFSRVDQFSDFTEGMMTAKTFHSSVSKMIGEGATEERAIDVTMALAAANTFMHHKYFFANCWAELNYQSNLLWRSYGQIDSASKYPFKIAIKTTVNRLRRSFINPPSDMEIGRAKYYDTYRDDPYEEHGNDFAKGVFLKQIEYQDEHEIRLTFLHESHDQHIEKSFQSSKPIKVGNEVITFSEGTKFSDLAETPLGLALKVDLEVLIEEIYFEAIPLNRSQNVNRSNEVEKVKNEATSRLGHIKDTLCSKGLADIPIFISEVS